MPHLINLPGTTYLLCLFLKFYKPSERIAWRQAAERQVLDEVSWLEVFPLSQHR